MKRTLFASMLVLAAVTGCSKKDSAKEGAASAQPAGATASAATTAAAAGAAKPSGPASGALAHLPAKCEAVVHVDVAGTFAVPAIKGQVVPALEDMKKAEPKDDAGKRAKAFLADAGIDPVNDVKELAICFTELKPGASADPKFTVAIGGNFKPGSIVPALEKNGKAEKFKVEEFEGTKLLTDNEGKMFLAQAADGAVIFATSKEALSAGLKTSDAASAYQIPTDVALAFVMPGEFMKTAMAGNGSPFAAQADKMGRAVFAVDLKKPDVQLRIAMADEKSATEFAGVLKMLLGQIAQQPSSAGDPMAPVTDLMKTAKVETKDKETVVQIAIPAEKLNDMAKMLVDSMKEGAGGASGPFGAH